MSILIKGMEMPPNCCQCPVNMEVCKRGYKYLLAHPELYDKRADDCPLVEIPPHCRLIDADADAEEVVVHCNNEENAKIIATLLNMDADGHYLLYSSIFGEEEEPAPPKEEK